MSTPCHSKLADKSPTPPSSVPRDKPLPSPPVAQLAIEESKRSSATLIDASDIPLRRSPQVPGQEPQEWPVLIPTNRDNRDTLQQVLRESGNQLKQQMASIPKERYPKLGDISQKTLSEDQLPISQYSKACKVPDSGNILQESASRETDVFTTSDPESPDTPLLLDLERPRTDSADIQAPTSSPSLSAGAAAVEKSTLETKKPSDPRQTRTSSLRARLSAGQLVKDDRTKVLGFTDFTAQPTSGLTLVRQGSHRAVKEAKSGSLQGTVASSKEQNGNREPPTAAIRAPAQFVAGSRRPQPVRRPVSRGGNRPDSRDSSSTLSSRPASRQTSTISTNTLENGPCRVSKSQPRKSSIPLPNHVAAGVIKPNQREESTTSHDKKNGATPNKSARNEFTIFQDSSSANLTQALDGGGPNHSTKEPSKQSKGLKEGSGACFTIDESPHRFHTKRLSSKAPEYGPRLKISRSAERLIMGSAAEKENMPLQKVEATSKPKVVNSPQRGGEGVSNGIKKSRSRPLSMQSILQASPKHDKSFSDAREKKAKSVDLSSMLSFQLSRSSSRQLTGLSNKSSSTNDPFFDAHENFSSGRSTPRASAIDHTTEPLDEAAWISPLRRRTAETDGIGQQPSEIVIAKDESSANNVPEAQKSGHDKTKIHESADALATANADKATNDLFSSAQTLSNAALTQDGSSQKPISVEFPPRSSSRPVHGDYDRQVSPITVVATEKGPQTPPKDFIRRQNNLGARQGLGSSQLDLSRYNHRRDSLTRDSAKSQSSMSKTVLSNFRGFFNKRSGPDPRKASSRNESSNRNRKPIINYSGSPFPPPTDIHASQRSTVASNQRRLPSRALGTASTPPRAPVAVATPLTVNGTPALASPLPTDVSATTSLAMQILDSARVEQSSPKKENLLQLGKIMVDAITQARDAEKAVEEAHQAARRAEIASAQCQASLREMSRLIVQEWNEAAMN